MYDVLQLTGALIQAGLTAFFVEFLIEHTGKHSLLREYSLSGT